MSEGGSDARGAACARVLHSPINVAGGPGALSAGMRELGCASSLTVFNERPFVRGYDRNLRLRQGGTRLDLVRNVPPQVGALVGALPRHDVFHFHFGLTLAPRRITLPLLRRAGKGVVFHFWGSDIRDRRADELNYLRWADAAIVGSYATLERAPRGAGWPPLQVVPPGIDLAAWQPAYPQPGRLIRIAHAPSKRRVKGTQAVLDAVAALKASGAPVELDLIEGVPNAQARERYAQADIVVDQLLVGWYGLLAIESMALGKPVVCHLDEPAAQRTADAFGASVPIVRASEPTLQQTLAQLVSQPDHLTVLGRQGRSYVERVHAHTQVARRVLDIYADAGLPAWASPPPVGAGAAAEVVSGVPAREAAR